MNTESPGVLIGLSNVLTARRDRVPRGGEPDAAHRQRLLTKARRALEGREAYVNDAVLLGRRVRLFSNSHHLADFWRDLFPIETEWRAATGRDVPREPALTVHAVVGVEDEPQASYRCGADLFLFNTSYFQDLRAGVLEALASPDLVHGGAVEIHGRGLAWTYPKEVIHPTPTWGLMETPGAKLVTDGWLLREDGRVVAVERRLYVRCSIVAAFPALAHRLVRAKFENVPSPTAAQADALARGARETLDGALRADPRGALASWPEAKALDFALRLIADPDARALVDGADLYGKARLTASAKVSAAFELRAGEGAETPGAVGPFAAPGWVFPAGGDPRALARRMAAKV
jgi:hypothetical protein